MGERTLAFRVLKNQSYKQLNHSKSDFDKHSEKEILEEKEKPLSECIPEKEVKW